MGIKIITAGFMTTIQDMGRFGYQETGMSVSGVMDTRSAALANILVGNEENEGVLEVTMMGPSMQFTEDNIIAVTGGDLGAKLDGAPLPRYEAVLVHAGQTVSFAGLFSGARAFVAFAGGLDVPVVMGSKATNLKSKIGGFEGRKLASGDEIPFADPKRWIPNMKLRKMELPDYSAKSHTLRVLLGPQDDHFKQSGIDTFLNHEYTISNEYDRMGCRMQGPVIKHKVGGDIITDGISFGAVQVPSHGNPIVMMADHQTTGGYTKIANVISVDLPVLAQCMPGHKIRFEEITIEKAQKLYCEEKKEFAALKEKFSVPDTEPETIPELPAPVNVQSVQNVPVEELQAVALAAAANEHKSCWNREGTYRVIVNGQEFVIELEKETKRFK